MSRETDSSSSGAQGRGSAAYPSGTPPYGSSPYPSLHPDGQDGAGAGVHDEPAEAPEPAEPRTETTLTTRIRINIPGSRPIPPVVMRKPMSGADADGASGDGGRGGDTTGETVWPPSEPLSAAPSARSGASAPAAGADSGAGAGAAAGAAAGQPPLPTRVQGATVRDNGADGADGSASGSGSASASADEKPASDWFAPRKSPAPSQPSPAAPSGGPQGDGQRDGQGGGQRDGLPYFTDAPGVPGGQGAGATASGPDAPSGPTTGPVSGLSNIPSHAPGAARGGGAGPSTGQGRGQGPGGAPGQDQGFGAETTGQHQLPGAGPAAASGPGSGPDGRPDSDSGSDSASSPWTRVQPGPQGPSPSPSPSPFPAPTPYGANPLGGTDGADGRNGVGGRNGGGRNAAGGPHPVGNRTDDTAILTPQSAPRDDLPGADTPGPGPMTPPGYVSGDTLTSGIPVVQPEGPRNPFPGGPNLTPRLPDPPGAADLGQGAPARTEPAPPPAPKPAAPAKKGRSKLVLLAVVAVVAAGGVYGAGLLLNHTDVPKGTTVLGVDIGGGTKDEAVVKLDSVLGKRAGLPLQLSVDGKQTQLAPGNAGLTLDSQETVRGASGSDYNPVSVVGSLFGGQRVAEPVIPVDEEKLTVALTSLADTSGTASDGTVVFSTGKAVAVPGKPGKALDVQASMKKVRDAFFAQIASGRAVPVELPAVTKQPTVSQAELDRAMNEFAEPAMSGNIKIQAGGKSIPFGPARSLPKILSMKAQGGKLVPVYNLAAMEKLCDGAFDEVMITRADGTKQPVTMEDVRTAMQLALVGKTPAERTRSIPLNQS